MSSGLLSQVFKGKSEVRASFYTTHCSKLSSSSWDISQEPKRCTRSPNTAFPVKGHLQDGLLRKKGLCRCPDISGYPDIHSAGAAGTGPSKYVTLQGLFSLKHIFLSLDTNTLKRKTQGWSKKRTASRGSTWEEHQEQKPVDVDLQSCRPGRDSSQC